MAPRIKTLLNDIRDDNGYLCIRKTFKDSTKSCIRGTTKALMAYAELPEFWEHKSCKRTIDYFLSRNIYYKKPDLTEKIRGGMKLSFPFTIDSSLLEPLYALSTMGYGRKRALSDAWGDLDNERDSSGYYKLQWSPSVPFKTGNKDEINEWVTFYALTALKRAGRLKGY